MQAVKRSCNSKYIHICVSTFFWPHNDDEWLANRVPQEGWGLKTLSWVVGTKKYLINNNKLWKLIHNLYVLHYNVETNWCKSETAVPFHYIQHVVAVHSSRSYLIHMSTSNLHNHGHLIKKNLRHFQLDSEVGWRGWRNIHATQAYCGDFHLYICRQRLFITPLYPTYKSLIERHTTFAHSLVVTETE